MPSRGSRGPRTPFVADVMPTLVVGLGLLCVTAACRLPRPAPSGEAAGIGSAPARWLLVAAAVVVVTGGAPRPPERALRLARRTRVAARLMTMRFGDSPERVAVQGVLAVALAVVAALARPTVAAQADRAERTAMACLGGSRHRARRGRAARLVAGRVRCPARRAGPRPRAHPAEREPGRRPHAAGRHRPALEHHLGGA